jgi:hypothetical protein
MVCSTDRRSASWEMRRAPSRTQRTPRVTVAPRRSSSSSKPQWVANRRPSATPAVCSSSAPVHTLVVHRAEADTFANQASSSGFDASRRVPCPPGTSTTSSGGWSVNEASGSTRRPLLQRTGSEASWATSSTRSGRSPDCSRSMAEAVNTSHGPTKSSSSASGKITRPIVYAMGSV